MWCLGRRLHFRRYASNSILCQITVVVLAHPFQIIYEGRDASHRIRSRVVAGKKLLKKSSVNLRLKLQKHLFLIFDIVEIM